MKKFIVIALVPVLGLWGYWFYHSLSVVNLGERGDSFGSLNTLFTGLAFIALVATLLLQLEDLKVTREEMRKGTTAQNRIARLNALGAKLSFIGQMKGTIPCTADEYEELKNQINTILKEMDREDNIPEKKG